MRRLSVASCCSALDTPCRFHSFRINLGVEPGLSHVSARSKTHNHLARAAAIGSSDRRRAGAARDIALSHGRRVVLNDEAASASFAEVLVRRVVCTCIAVAVHSSCSSIGPRGDHPVSVGRLIPKFTAITVSLHRRMWHSSRRKCGGGAVQRSRQLGVRTPRFGSGQAAARFQGLAAWLRQISVPSQESRPNHAGVRPRLHVICEGGERPSDV